jgi:hypothetical protein
MIPPMISMEEGMADPAALRNESARQCKHQGERVAQVELTKEVIDGPCARGYLRSRNPDGPELRTAVTTYLISSLAA